MTVPLKPAGMLVFNIYFLGDIPHLVYKSLGSMELISKAGGYLQLGSMLANRAMLAINGTYLGKAR